LNSKRNANVKEQSIGEYIYIYILKRATETI